MPRNLIVLCALLAFNPGQVATAQEYSRETRASNSTIHYSSIASEYWDLSQDEIVRLNILVNVERAFSDVDNLTPYEILGKYADTDSERREYAKRYVLAQSSHQKRSLRWAAMVADSAKKHEAEHRAEVLTDSTISKYLGALSPLPTSKVETRWHLHVPATCSTCEAIIDRASSEIQSGAIEGLDVVFVGMRQVDEKLIKDWVKRAGFNRSDLGSRVTINLDSDSWSRERGGHDVPMLLNGATADRIEF